MAHAERCPICGGNGVIQIVDPLTGMGVNTTAGPMTKPCHGCSGAGWVVVP